MNPLTFTKEQKERLYYFHYSPTNQQVLIEKSFLKDSNSPVFQEWAKSENTLFHKFGINNSSSGENTAIYLKLIAALTNNFRLYGSFYYDPHFFKEQCDAINWEYEIENEYTDTTTGHSTRNIGFVEQPDFSRVVHNFRIYEITTFQALVDLQNWGSSNEYGLINLYALKQTTKAELLDFLTQKEKPNLSSLLKEDELFIALNVGYDLGYYDYLLLASPKDLGPELQKLALLYENFATEYERTLHSVTLKEIEKKFEALHPAR